MIHNNLVPSQLELPPVWTRSIQMVAAQKCVERLKDKESGGLFFGDDDSARFGQQVRYFKAEGLLQPDLVNRTEDTQQLVVLAEHLMLGGLQDLVRVALDLGWPLKGLVDLRSAAVVERHLIR